MRYKVELSMQADSDLRGIFEHIAFSLLSPANAVAQLNRLESCIEELGDLPNRFRLYEHEPWKSRGLRIMPVDNYCVFYIPDEDTHIVTIIRVIYGGRDIQSQLQLRK